MKVTNIKESGSHNTLLWALQKNAQVYGDIPLCSIINNELFYLVTFSDVNFFELFRLTQQYREKVRIIEEKVVCIPPRSELAQYFPGSFEDNGKKVPNLEMAEYAMQQFVNLALQMNADSDIIRPSASRLFIPMLARKFDVQIPVSFFDVVSSIKNEEEAAKLFNDKYPENLNEQVLENSENGILMCLEMMFVKSTSILKYNETFDKYLTKMKYYPLKSVKTEKLYKYALVGFFKYDNISRGEVRVNLLQPDEAKLGEQLKTIGILETPMKIEFMIQLPIQYMMMLENYFSPEELFITYESSMARIIDESIDYKDFVSPEWDTDQPDNLNEEQTAIINEYNNATSAYHQRIDESNTNTLNVINMLLTQKDVDIDVTSAFSMLPAIYATKAMIVLNLEYAEKYVNIYDPLLAEMFQDMLSMAERITEDVHNAK